MRVITCLIACVTLSLIDAQAEQPSVWTKNPNGWAYHALSGLGCAPVLAGNSGNSAANVTLKDVIVGSNRQPAGYQVGCDYEGAQGAWASVEITNLRASESVATQAIAIGNKIQAQFPTAKRAVKKTKNHPFQLDTVTSSLGRKPANPTGGDTFAMAFYEIKAGNRAAVLAVAGGDVDGWMLTLIQLDHGDNAADLQSVTVSNWERLVAARRGGRRTAGAD